MTGAVDSQMKGFASHLSLGCDSLEPRQEVKWSLATHHRDLPLSSLTLHQRLITPQTPKLLWMRTTQVVRGEKKKTNELFCVLWSDACMCMCKGVCVHACMCVCDVCETCLCGRDKPATSQAP